MRPATASSASLVSVPDVVAGRGILVGFEGVGERERVVDHAVDIGVLEQQRARPDAVDRVPEAPDPVAVRVRDGAIALAAMSPDA
jgi:hypothetical protein